MRYTVYVIAVLSDKKKHLLYLAPAIFTLIIYVVLSLYFFGEGYGTPLYLEALGIAYMEDIQGFAC